MDIRAATRSPRVSAQEETVEAQNAFKVTWLIKGSSGDLGTYSIYNKRGSAQVLDDEANLGTFEGYAQGLEAKELENQENENKCKALKSAIKSIEGIASAESKLIEYKKEFDIAIQEYEKKMNLIQLSIKTQVEIQLGLILSGIENSGQ